MQDNIRRTLQIINHIQRNKIAAMVNSIDVDKASVNDSVNWNFLYRVLHKFGLLETVIKTTIKALYYKPNARIKVNGILSNIITLERGCACSPKQRNNRH